MSLSDERWKDSYDAWKTRVPDNYEVTAEDERDPCREGECFYWPGCGCEYDLPEQRDGCRLGPECVYPACKATNGWCFAERGRGG